MENQVANFWNKAKKTTEQIKRVLSNAVTQKKNYLPVSTVEASFLGELSKEKPRVALNALHQFMSNGGAFNISMMDGDGVEGRTLAILFQNGLLTKQEKDSANSAFKASTETWKRELEIYKADYDKLKKDFADIERRLADKEKELEAFRKSTGEGFEGLRAVYEKELQLKGPIKYWNDKRKEHEKHIYQLRLACFGFAFATMFVVYVCAQVLLPEVYPSNMIPWRNLGLFLLISTFLVWLMRICIKLLLSNIHLRDDARERQVMISTYMSLMQKKEAREALSKDALALILAPIFRPSTSGVVKDDGGPMTLTDFIDRLKK